MTTMHTQKLPKAPRPARASSPRRHDLDALRAGAMLLGIALHAALSYARFPWIAVNDATSPALGAFIEVVHGFRLPLFFLMSGYFGMMLLARRGARGFLAHRWKRVGLPLLLGLLTIVPAMWGVIILGTGIRMAAPPPERDRGAGGFETTGIWQACETGDLATVRELIEGGADVNQPDPMMFTLPLAWASTGDHADIVGTLLDAGANPNALMGDGSTPLHTAFFFGAHESAALLLDAGAQTDIRNSYGDTPPESMLHEQGAVDYIANLLGVEADYDEVAQGRAEIRAMLAAQDDPGGGTPAASSPLASGLIAWALNGELFMHLWFLWHLCWLAVALAVTALIVRTIGVRTVPRFLVATPLCLVALVPLSAVTQGWQANFGPDTSASLVPAFRVLAHYAVFFGFGALMFCVPSAADRLGRAWWAYLPLAALACFAALRLTHDPSAFAGRGIDGALGAKLAPWLQSAFVWCTSLGLMGLARTLLGAPNPRVRYISDASYWLYVAHLPVVLAGQFALAYVPLPPLVEFVILTVGATALMLATYRWWVRGTWVGVLLNGVRIRPGAAQATAQPAPTNPQTGESQEADKAAQSPAVRSQPRLEGANL